ERVAGTTLEGLAPLAAEAERQLDNARRMGETIAGYCWEADTIDALRIAPFHLLAAEGQIFTDRDHAWHMETLASLATHDPILQATGWRRLDAGGAADRAALCDWWLDHTSKGGEGMVLKPATFLARGEKGLVQPAMKVRGRDYLRIIYGPDYDLPQNIERLRQRGLGRKFSLADREFRLGHEGLSRFVEKAPLAKVHQCALAVLALESEPVDPRL
ncbi:MAG: polynucleotide kinase-phosphatase, partial [Pseudomonadota bacterium]